MPTEQVTVPDQIQTGTRGNKQVLFSLLKENKRLKSLLYRRGKRLTSLRGLEIFARDLETLA